MIKIVLESRETALCGFIIANFSIQKFIVGLVLMILHPCTFCPLDTIAYPFFIRIRNTFPSYFIVCILRNVQPSNPLDCCNAYEIGVMLHVYQVHPKASNSDVLL